MKYNTFSFLESLSIEIGPGCNLSNIHTKCPAHYMVRQSKGVLSVGQIIDIMDQAVALSFNGYFAFHFYNEPLLYIEKIIQIKALRPNYKFLLWTNGTLIEKLLIDNTPFDDIFEKIVITKYPGADNNVFSKLQSSHNNVEIYDADMDDRIDYYGSITENYFACKKIYCELPIDCYGNIYVCVYDWEKRYLLGNVLTKSLHEILYSDTYQRLLKANEKKFRHGDDIINLCKYCPRPYLGKKNV